MNLDELDYDEMTRLIAASRRDAGMSARAIRAVLPRLGARLRHLGKYGILARKGEVARNFGLVIQGHLQLSLQALNQRRILMRAVRPGEFVGHSLLFQSEPHYICDVIAYPRCDVIVFDLAAARAWRRDSQSNRFFQMLEEQISRSLTVAWQRNAILSQRPIGKQVLAYLATRGVEEAARRIVIPGTMADFADFLGCDRAALVREITSLCEQGRIRRIGAGCFELLEPQGRFLPMSGIVSGRDVDW